MQNQLFARITWVVACVGALFCSDRAYACPYCSAVSMTFSEEIQRSDVVALVRQSTKDEASGIEIQEGQQSFTVLETLKGKEHLGKQERLVQVYLGTDPPDTTFLMMAIEPGRLSWGTPIPLSAEGVSYVKELPALVDKPVEERLRFFLRYLEHSDKLLNEDAYGEFSKAPFDKVQKLQKDLDHDRLLAWIQDENVTPSRRRLYFTLLGICGNHADVPLLEGMLKGNDRQARMSLDALINCYLMLRGPEGMALVEDLFLKNLKADYTDTYSAIVSLRVHGQEVKTIPRERLVQALRTILARPDLADLVIPDLARWEDWDSTHRLVQLFITADAKSSWVRVPVINFLQSSPEPRAKALLEFLAYLDPESYKRASAFAPFAADPGAAKAPAAVPSASGASGTSESAPGPAANANSSAQKPEASVSPLPVRPASEDESDQDPSASLPFAKPGLSEDDGNLAGSVVSQQTPSAQEPEGLQPRGAENSSTVSAVTSEEKQGESHPSSPRLAAFSPTEAAADLRSGDANLKGAQDVYAMRWVMGGLAAAALCSLVFMALLKSGG